MAPVPDLHSLHELLLSRKQLVTSGVTDRVISRQVEQGELTRVWRGLFIETSAWTDRNHVERHLLRALCAHQEATQAPIFSHLTAAAALGLPLMRFDATKVHTLQPRASGNGSSGRLIRHRQDFAAHDVEQVGPIACTSLTRTILDLARSCTFEQGVVAGDAGLRRLASPGTSESHRAQLLEHLQSLPGSRGHNRARRVLGFIDASAESPLETLFRLQFARLGFEVRTQVALPSPSGYEYRLDFELTGQSVFFEADGKSKYTDKRFRNGKSMEDVLLAEKQREDWIRGRTGFRILRGGWKESLTPLATAAMLRSYGVIPPVDPRHDVIFDLY